MDTAADLLTAELISKQCRRILDRDDDVNTLDLHHRVEIQYPMISLRKPGETVQLRMAGNNMEDRYDPVPPLVPDEAVTIHSGLLEPNNFVFASHYPIGYNEEVPATPRVREHNSLSNDLLQCQQFAGITTLRAVTYFLKADKTSGDHRLRLRVERDTVFPHELASTGLEGTQPYRSYRMYDMQLEDMSCHFEDNPSPWAAQLLELVDRESDKAVQYVASLCKDYDEDFFRSFRENEKKYWLGKREMDFGAVLDSKTKVIARNDPRVKDQACAICAEDFGPGVVPIELTCHATHVLCRQCLLELCLHAETWLETIKCPQCREPAFSKEEMDRLKFGIINGDFYYEKQYTEWENFQRSCADLDKEDVTNKTSILTLGEATRFLLFDSWLYLFLEDLKGIQGPTLEDRIVMLAISEELYAFSGQSIPSNILFYHLHHAIYTRLLRAYKSHGWLRYLHPDDAARLSEAPQWKYFEDYLLRPGYSSLIQRSLKRALRFIELRECGRRGPAHEGCRHFHHGRGYYNFHGYLAKVQGGLPKLMGWETGFGKEDWEGVYRSGVKRERRDLERRSVKRLFRVGKGALAGGPASRTRSKERRRERRSGEKRLSNGRMVID